MTTLYQNSAPLVTIHHIATCLAPSSTCFYNQFSSRVSQRRRMLTNPPNSRLSFSRFHRIRYILLRLQDFLSHDYFSFSLFLASTAKDHHRISSLLRHWGCFLPPLSCPLSLSHGESANRPIKNYWPQITRKHRFQFV